MRKDFDYTDSNTNPTTVAPPKGKDKECVSVKFSKESVYGS